MKRTRLPWMVLAALVVAAGAGAGWALWPDPEPEEEPIPGETGMDEETTRELLQEIGYLK